MHRKIFTAALLSVGAAVLTGGGASANVVSGGSVVFSGGSATIGFSDSGDFTFKDVSQQSIFDAVSVMTSGGGQVTVVGAPFFSSNRPTAYQDPRGGFSAPTFGPGIPLENFGAFPTAATIPGSGTLEIIGLLDTVDGEDHYGYAELYGPQLVSYAFESTPDAPIVPGVPLPASAPLFGTALLGLATVGYVVKRTSGAAAP